MSKRTPILIGLLILALFVWLSLTSNVPVQYVMTRLDRTFYDIQLRIHVWSHPKASEGNIVIVDVDDASLKQEGRWPWPRSLLAKLIYQLKNKGAVVVATDMMFAEPEINVVSTILDTLNEKKLSTPDIISRLTQISPEFEHDVIFSQSLQQIDAVLGMVLLPRVQEQGVLPPPLMQLNTQQASELSIIKTQGYISNISVLQTASKRAGFLNIFSDIDGIIRRAPVILRYKDAIYPSLALEAVQQYLLINHVDLITPYYGNAIRLEGIQFGNIIIPTDERGEVLIPFIGESYTFPYYSATDVLHDKLPPHALEGKFIFIGTSATGEGDIKATSIDKVFPGVEIQATIANGMLTHYFPYTPPWAKGAELFFTIVIGVLAAVVFPYLGPVMVSALMVSIPVAFVFFLFVEEWLWNKTGFIFSILIPTMLIIVLSIFNIIYGYLFEARRRQKIKNMFGQYVPKKHIEEMLKAKGSYGLLGEDREMTVLFADIRNFTTISEGLKASELKEMLNAFFTPMTEIIFKHKGTIDKYVGDLIMAFWGAPLKDRNHAQHAIVAALEMQRAITEMAPEIANKGWPEIKMGIGLNSGMVSVGDMGSKFRRNYTVLGDAVNLASRVESLTKFYGVYVMVTENTVAGQKNFIFRKLDKVRVKGKQLGIDIYEIVCEKKTSSPELEQELDEYNHALNYYFAQQFSEAAGIFSLLAEKHPHTKIYKIYLERISVFNINPPPPDWDGVYTHATK